MEGSSRFRHMLMIWATKADRIAMTDGMLARETLERKEAWAFDGYCFRRLLDVPVLGGRGASVGTRRSTADAGSAAGGCR